MFFQRYVIINGYFTILKVTPQFETFNQCAIASIALKEAFEYDKVQFYFEGIRDTEDETGLHNLWEE